MAKPRIFVSSTYYDLKHIRTNLESFIASFGYEPVLFESGDIHFSHDKPLDESCYTELQNCHMQILIIGGSYGSPESGVVLTEEQQTDQYFKFNSITKTEFQVALKRQLPIYFFVENGVLSEYTTYKKNRENTEIHYAHVSSVNIFTLLDEIYALKTGNFIRGFTKFEDISNWLRVQWAHLMAEFINNRTEQIALSSLNIGLEKLNLITSSLQEYTEAILTKVEPDKAVSLKENQKNKVIHGHIDRLSREGFFKSIFEIRSDITDQELYDIFVKSEDLSDFVLRSLPEPEMRKIYKHLYKQVWENDFVYQKMI